MGNTTDTGRLAHGKRLEIDRLMGVDPSKDRKRLSASLSQDVEWDGNVLNENENTVEKTDAAALKFTTIGDARYELVRGDRFYLTPSLNFNLVKYLATKSEHQDSVNT